MTRFARSKGSKASNERLPEEATPWREMKKQINQEPLEDKKEFDIKKAKAYMDFVKDEAVKKSQIVTWAEFEDHKTVKLEKRNKRKAVDGEGSLQKKMKDANAVQSKQPKGEAAHVTKSEKLQKKRTLKNAVVVRETKEMDNKKSDIEKEGSPEALKKIQKKKAKRLRQIEKKKKHPDKASQNPSPKKLDYNKNSSKPLQSKQPKKLKDPRNKTPSRPDTQITLDGNVIDIAYFQGFPIRKEDQARLKQLQKDMISKGIPRSQINVALKMERRKAEKALAREKKKVCFNCRVSGHLISECPDLEAQNQAGTGICFKCGSTEHTHFQCKVVREQEFKFAQCFICNEQVKQ